MHLVLASPVAAVATHTGLLSPAPWLSFYRTNSPTQRPTRGGLKPVAKATAVYVRRLPIAHGDVNRTLDAQIHHAARHIKHSTRETVDVSTCVQSISPDGGVAGSPFRPAAMERLLGVDARSGATLPRGLSHGFTWLSLRKRMRLFRCGAFSLDVLIASTDGHARI